jgi:hypothetical protein
MLTVEQAIAFLRNCQQGAGYTNVLTADRWEIAALLESLSAVKEQAEASAAAMREMMQAIVDRGQAALDKGFRFTIEAQKQFDDAKTLLNGPAGASLLAEVRELREQNKAMRNCGNCAKPCMRGPVKSELDVLDRRDKCKGNGLSEWQYRGEGDARVL